MKSRISEVGSKFSVSSFAVRIDLSLQLSMVLVWFAAHVFSYLSELMCLFSMLVFAHTLCTSEFEVNFECLT